MRFLLAFLVFAVGLQSNQAALTLISRETFQGVGTLNSGTPGNLGTVQANSNFYKRAVGPKVSGDSTARGLGWSADLHLTSANPDAYGRHDISPTGASITSGFFTCWYYLDSYNSNGNRIDILGNDFYD